MLFKIMHSHSMFTFRSKFMATPSRSTGLPSSVEQGPRASSAQSPTLSERCQHQRARYRVSQVHARYRQVVT
jgi:hypothetical protein